MSTNYPTSLDLYTDYNTGDTVQASHINDPHDAIETIEAKVGVDGSAVTTSHDYKLSEVTSTDKAVGKTATQTLTNKTLTTPTIASLANATHTHQNAAGGGTLDAAAIAAGTMATARLGSGSASSSTFLRGDNTWASPTGTGDVVGPSSATDNAIARFDNTTGKLIQNSTVTIGDAGVITSAITTGNGLTMTGATTGNLISLTPSGALANNTQTSGAFVMDFTSATGIAFQLYTNRAGGSLSYPQIYIAAANTAYDQPLIQLVNNGTSGNACHLRVDGPSPQIEFRETDQPSYGVTGDGQFEIQVQGDIFFINGRNITNTSFENSIWFLRPESGFNGNMGIGANPYGIEKLTIGNTTGGAPRIALKETTAPTATASYGKIYVKSSDSDLYFMDSAGTEFNLLTSGTGDFVGPASSTDNAVVRFDGTTGKLGQNSTVTIGDTGGIATTIAAAGNAVGLTVTQNDTTNNPRGISIVNAGTAQSLFIDPNGAAATSRSTGGAVLLENTGNSGAGLVIYSNHATATGNLLSVWADNVGYATQPVYIQNDGTSHSVSIVHNASGSSANGMSIVSTNTADTTLGISGVETGRGTIKVTHTGTGTDANASAISISLAGSGTAAQGIFIDTVAGTTGKLLNLRDLGSELLTLTATAGLVVNEAGTSAADFRVEGDTDTEVLFVDASADKMGVSTTTPTSTLDVQGSFGNAYRAITALRTLDSTDHIIDCTSGTYTVTLPTAASITGREYIIKNSGTGVITVDGNASETIDGALTYILGTQYDSLTIISNGANWIII